MKGSARGNWDPQEVQLPFQPKRGGGPHHHVEAVVDWCSSTPIVTMVLVGGLQSFARTVQIHQLIVDGNPSSIKAIRSRQTFEFETSRTVC